jgi:hypothetical protein
MSSRLDTNQDRLRRIYDDYRTVWMSREYYACRLSRYQRYNLVYEVALAVGASSTVAGWYIWQTPAGKTSWAVFAGVVAVLAIIKPILQLSKEIERYSKLFVGYSDLFYDYRYLVDAIKVKGGITKELRELTPKAENRYKELALQDDPKPSKRLLLSCQREVQKKAAPFRDWCPRPVKKEEV